MHTTLNGRLTHWDQSSLFTHTKPTPVTTSTSSHNNMMNNTAATNPTSTSTTNTNTTPLNPSVVAATATVALSSSSSTHTASATASVSTTTTAAHGSTGTGTGTTNQLQSYHHLPYEERLPKIWRPLASSIANCMNKAEKAGAESSQANCRELNDSVMTFLRTRMEWHRLLGNVEAKLQGKAQEREALEGYVRTQPRLGKRKRTTAEQLAAAELQTAMEQVAAAELAVASTSTDDTPTCIIID